MELKKIEPFSDIFAKSFEDPNVIFLIWVSTVYLAISIWAQSDSYVECLTIFFGLFSVNLIGSICDYSKNKQFLGLQDEINKEKVIVYRGAYGTTDSIKLKNLVVGDVIHVQQGDRVPADCILVDEMNIMVDQTMYHKNQVLVPKSVSIKFPSPSEEEGQGYNTQAVQNLPADGGLARQGAMGEEGFEAHNNEPNYGENPYPDEAEPYAEAEDRENVDHQEYMEGGESLSN